MCSALTQGILASEARFPEVSSTQLAAAVLGTCSYL